MANHKSALKRIRSNEKRRVLNKYQHKTNVIHSNKAGNLKSQLTKHVAAI